MLLAFVALSLRAPGILTLDGASSCNVSPAIAGNGAPISPLFQTKIVAMEKRRHASRQAARQNSDGRRG
jgi:hypothetical protein